MGENPVKKLLFVASGQEDERLLIMWLNAEVGVGVGMPSNNKMQRGDGAPLLPQKEAGALRVEHKAHGSIVYMLCLTRTATTKTTTK
eukprot:2908819-Ditylum_brightwellii.AAC.1